jgi:hypothetical protein
MNAVNIGNTCRYKLYRGQRGTWRSGPVPATGCGRALDRRPVGILR